MERGWAAVTCDGRLFHRRAAATVHDDFVRGLHVFRDIPISNFQFSCCLQRPKGPRSTMLTIFSQANGNMR